MASESSTNIKKEIAYELWKLDDGDCYTENLLNGVARCLTTNVNKFCFQHPFGHKGKVHKLLRRNKYLKEYGINLKNKEEVESCMDCICNKLRERMSLKEYTQYFHILSLLGIPKNSDKLPELSRDTNVMYNIAYKLWACDTSEENWNTIERIVYLSSKLKK